MDDWPSQTRTPLEAIERIAQSADRVLAIQFFLFFSRFEYALKRLPKISVKDSGVQPDWDGYAKERYTAKGESEKGQKRGQALPIDITDRLARTLLAYGVTEFATPNTRFFEEFGFARGWCPVSA